MGSTPSHTEKKDEILVFQNAAGTSHVEDIKQHVGYTSTVLTCILILMAIAILVLLYKAYKRCHNDMIQMQLNQHTLRRYASVLRRRQTGSVPDQIVDEATL